MITYALQLQIGIRFKQTTRAVNNALIHRFVHQQCKRYFQGGYVGTCAFEHVVDMVFLAAADEYFLNTSQRDGIFRNVLG